MNWRWQPRSVAWGKSRRTTAARGSQGIATWTASPLHTRTCTGRPSLRIALLASCMPDRLHSVLDGSTFIVGNRVGDVGAGGDSEEGFFCDDTRFVSRWILRVDERPLTLLGLDQSAHYAAQFFVSPQVRPDDEVPWSIVRRRLVDHVWMEEIRLTSHLHAASSVHLALEIDTDFADLFEVKDVASRERD